MNVTTDFRPGTVALVRRQPNPETGVRPHATIGLREPFGWRIAWADEYGNGGAMLLRDTDYVVSDVVPLDIPVSNDDLARVGLAWPHSVGCPSITDPSPAGEMKEEQP